MRRRKVTRILGLKPVPEGDAIQIALYASDLPTCPWAASSEGYTARAATPYLALDLLLETLAKLRRAEEQV